MDTASALGNGTEGLRRWSLRLFGGFELGVRPDGQRVAPPGKRERVMLAYLALSPNYRQPRRKLVTLLWGDAADETTLDNLRNCLWNLRKALGDTEHRVVASEGEDIVLHASAFEVDALEFRRLATQSGRTELEAAAKLYTGEFLDGLVIESEEFESWRRAEAARYREQAIDVLTRLMTQLSECGETERAIEMGLRILRLEPLHEAALRRVMRHYSESGRRGAAIQLYRTFADALRTELDAQPEAETRAIFSEIARGGEERASDSHAADAEPPSRYTRIARPSDARGRPLRPVFRFRTPLSILAGAAIVATALTSYRQFAPLGITTADRAVVAEQASSDPQPSAISIAVLPFVNMSGDSAQEFFSDGISEEITSALANVQSLRVIGRTSAFQFKGDNKDLRAIGQALGTTHLIEGSVRKVGDRVRITAQLIRVDDGSHLWTENYDRQLNDIFAIQEDIAQAIAGALRIPLGLAPGETLISNRSIDPESYEQYLRAKAMMLALGRKNVTDARNIMERLVERNPDYAPAWALLSEVYGRGRNTSLDAFDPRTEAAARRAIELDPNLADGYRALGAVELRRQKLLLAEELLSKALALDPNHQDVLFQYSNLLAGVGRLKEALAMKQQLRALEPFVPLYNSNLANSLWLNGQDEAAIEIFKDMPANESAGGTPGGRGEMAEIYAAAGRYSEAADLVLELSSMNLRPELAAITKEAARLLRTAPAKSASPQSLPRLADAGFVYLHIGAPDRALENYEELGEAGSFSPAYIAMLWHPSNAPVRKTERFKAYVRKAGLVDYWRARGWPEFCRPMATDDFVCV